jgi:hypothetical protein
MSAAVNAARSSVPALWLCFFREIRASTHDRVVVAAANTHHMPQLFVERREARMRRKCPVRVGYDFDEVERHPLQKLAPAPEVVDPRGIICRYDVYPLP